MIFQRNHQAHDRAFNQPGTLNQFHQAQCRIANLESREHGQDRSAEATPFTAGRGRAFAIRKRPHLLGPLYKSLSGRKFDYPPRAVSSPSLWRSTHSRQLEQTPRCTPGNRQERRVHLAVLPATHYGYRETRIRRPGFDCAGHTRHALHASKAKTQLCRLRRPPQHLPSGRLIAIDQ